MLRLESTSSICTPRLDAYRSAMPSAIEIPSLVAEKPTLYRTTDPLLKRLRLEDPYGRPIDTIAKDFEGKEIIIFFVGSAHGDGELALAPKLSFVEQTLTLHSL